MQTIGIALIALAFGWATQTPPKDQSADLKTCTLKVTGMACEICAGNVEKEAKRIDGVKAATVDQRKGVARVTYDPAKTTPARIAKIIEEKTSFNTEVQPPDPPKR